MTSIIKCIPQRFTSNKRRLLILSEFQFDEGIDAVSFYTTNSIQGILIKYKLIDYDGPGVKPAGIYYKNKAEMLHIPWDDKYFPLGHLVKVELYEPDGVTPINDKDMQTKDGPIL